MNAWSVFFIFITPMLGGAIALIFQQQAQTHYKLVLSFSGAFLFTIILLHLFPAVFLNTPHAGLFILLGFFVQIILEQLTHGIEHGHFHSHEHGDATIFSLMAGLSLHSLLDGLPLSSNEFLQQTHHALLYGIGIHKIPEGFALASILIVSQFKKSSVIILLVLFSLIAPVAMLTGHYIQSIQAALMNTMMAVALGSFLHVSTTILFESESSTHHFGWRRILSIVIGAGLALLFG